MRSVTLSRRPPSEISPTPQSTKCTLCPSCTPSSTTACLAPFTPRSSMDDLGRRERTGRRPQDSGPSRIKYRNDKHGAGDLSIGKHCCYTYELDRLRFIRKYFFCARGLFNKTSICHQRSLVDCLQLSLSIESDLVRL